MMRRPERSKSVTVEQGTLSSSSSERDVAASAISVRCASCKRMSYTSLDSQLTLPKLRC